MINLKQPADFNSDMNSHSVIPGRLARRFRALAAGILLALGSTAAQAVETHLMDFPPGWTLAGNSLTDPLDVGATFGGRATITSVWKWNAAGSKWAVYVPSMTGTALATYAASKGYDVLSSIAPGEGYWVSATEPVSLGSRTGTPFALGQAHIADGWNMVATGNDVGPTDIGTDIGNFTSLWAWNGAESRWHFHAPALAANNTQAGFIAGRGFREFGTVKLGKGRGFWVNRTPAVQPVAATVSAGNGQVGLSWAAVSGAGSYNIQRSTSGGAYSTLATGVTSPYQDTSVINGTAYSYIVVARDAANAADLNQSSPVTVTPSANALANSIGQNGIAVSMNGHTWTLGNAYVYRFSATGKREIYVKNPLVSPTALADMTQFNGVYLQEGSLSVPILAPGTFSCGANADNVAFGLRFTTGGDGWGGQYNATGCTVRLDYMSAKGGIKGEIVSATLSNGTRTFTVVNAPFRVYQHNGTPGTPPALPANAWSSLYISSGSFELTTGRHFLMPYDTGNKVGSSFSFGMDPNDGTDPVLVNGVPNTIDWIVQNSFFTTATNYTCGSVYTGGVGLNMQVWFGTYQAEQVYQSNPAGGGGNCTITISQIAGGLYKGQFTGTLKANDTLLANADETISVSGEFRNFVALPYVAGSGGNEGALPADGTTKAATMSVSDGSTHFTAGEQFRFDTFVADSPLNTSSFRGTFRHTADANFNLRLFEIPRAVGNYTCGTTYNGQKANLQVSTSRGVTYSGQWTTAGTSCTINITQYGTVIEGNYTATLGVGTNAGLASPVLPGNDALITVNGSFRLTPP